MSAQWRMAEQCLWHKINTTLKNLITLSTKKYYVKMTHAIYFYIAIPFIVILKEEHYLNINSYTSLCMISQPASNHDFCTPFYSIAKLRAWSYCSVWWNERYVVPSFWFPRYTGRTVKNTTLIQAFLFLSCPLSIFILPVFEDSRLLINENMPSLILKSQMKRITGWSRRLSLSHKHLCQFEECYFPLFFC